jgi:hypothetical protein
MVTEPIASSQEGSFVQEETEAPLYKVLQLDLQKLPVQMQIPELQEATDPYLPQDEVQASVLGFHKQLVSNRQDVSSPLYNWLQGKRQVCW